MCNVRLSPFKRLMCCCICFYLCSERMSLITLGDTIYNHVRLSLTIVVYVTVAIYINGCLNDCMRCTIYTHIRYMMAINNPMIKQTF